MLRNFQKSVSRIWQCDLNIYPTGLPKVDQILNGGLKLGDSLLVLSSATNEFKRSYFVEKLGNSIIKKNKAKEENPLFISGKYGWFGLYKANNNYTFFRNRGVKPLFEISSRKELNIYDVTRDLKYSTEKGFYVDDLDSDWIAKRKATIIYIGDIMMNIYTQKSKNDYKSFNVFIKTNYDGGLVQMKLSNN